MRRHIKKTPLIISLLFIIPTLGLLIWFSIEPRETPWLTAYIEQEISNENLSISIDQTFVVLDGFEELIDIRLKGITAKSGDSTLELPEASVQLSLVNLLNRKISVTQLTIKNPSLALHVKKGSISLESNEGVDMDALVYNTLDMIDSFAIQNADLSLYQDDTLVLRSPKTNIDLKKTGNFIAGNCSAYFNNKSYIQSNVAFNNKNQQLTLYGNVENLRLDVLRTFSDYAINLPLTGGFNIRMDLNKGTRSTAFNLFGKNGTVTIPEYFAEPLDVRTLHIQGSLANERMHITKAKLRLPEGNIDASLDYNQGKYAINATLTEYKMRDLYKHWPITLGPLTRKWVTKHIQVGDVEKATLSLSNQQEGNKLNSKIYFKNAVLDYYAPLPPVTHAKGVAAFDDSHMHITVNEGKMLEKSTTDKASVSIADFKKPVLEVRVDIASTLKEIWEFLSHKPFEYTQKFNINAQEGTAVGDLYLAIPLHKEPNIQFEAKANFDNASLTIDEINVSKAKGDFLLNNKELSINANGKLNGAAGTLKWQSVFGKKSTHIADVDLFITPDLLPESLRKHVNGVIRVHSLFHDGLIKTVADLTSATLDFYGVKKSAGVPGIIEFDMTKKGTEKFIDNLNVQWDGMRTQGKLSLDNNALETAHLTQVKFGKNNFALLLNNEAMEITGASLDIAPFLTQKHSVQKESHTNNFHIKAKLDTVFVLGDTGLKEVDADVFCRMATCDFVNINGKTHKPFSINKAGNSLKIQSADAGGFIQALGVSKSIKKGKLMIDGVEKDGVMEGTMRIKDFSVRNAPIMTKMLRLISVTGIINTIRGKSLSFDEAVVPFAYHNKKIEIKKGAIARGASVGFTGTGWVEIGGDLRIDGTIIPSYTFNTILGKIPLLGTALSGGEEGVFTTNYTVKKTGENITVETDPLSTFAPSSLKKAIQ